MKNNDSRYPAARIPTFANPLNLNEGDFVTVTGYLYLVATEDNDCEYHIQLSNQPRTTTSAPTPEDLCLIVEVAKPEDMQDPEMKKRAQAVRDYIQTKLLSGKEPSSTGNVMQHAIQVRVKGQLFFDDAHLRADGTPEPRGKKKMTSQTLWELHPIFDFVIVK